MWWLLLEAPIPEKGWKTCRGDEQMKLKKQLKESKEMYTSSIIPGGTRKDPSQWSQWRERWPQAGSPQYRLCCFNHRRAAFLSERDRTLYFCHCSVSLLRLQRGLVLSPNQGQHHLCPEFVQLGNLLWDTLWRLQVGSLSTVTVYHCASLHAAPGHAWGCLRLISNINICTQQNGHGC